VAATKSQGLSPLYQYEHVREALNRFTSQSTSEMQEAWRLAQEIIEAQARFYRAFWDEPTARAKAWEDFEIACRGRGAAGISGAVFELWQHLPRRKDNAFLAAMEQGFAKAHQNTDPRFLRYRPHDRNAKLRTLEDGFDEPEASAIDIPIPEAVKNFALTAGVQVMEFEPPPKEDKPKQNNATASPFTVIRGGRDGDS
jgi:hypothetical protein